MEDSEGPALLGLTTIDRHFAELAKGKGYARAQRRSWVIGEMMLEHPEMTREDAERIVGEVGG